MDKLPQQVKEFLQDATRVEALFPNLSKEERLAIHTWVTKGRHPLQHASHNDPIQGRVLRLKKLTGEYTEVTPVSHFTMNSPKKSPKTPRTPKAPKVPKPPKNPADPTKPSRKKKKIDYSSANDLANLVGQTFQPPSGPPTTSTYAMPAQMVKPGVYDDKKPMYIRGLIAKMKAMKTLEFHNDHKLDLIKKVTTRLSLFLGAIRNPQQAKEQIEGIGIEMSKQLADIQATGCVDNTPPPHGHYLCAAPAMLVALLNAKRNEQLEFLSKEQLIERASKISEEKFDPVHIGAHVEFIAWSRIHHLDKLNYVKMYHRKQISINGVYKLEPLGEEMAYKLLGELPPTQATIPPNLNSTTPTPPPPNATPSSPVLVPATSTFKLPNTPTRAPARPATPILAPEPPHTPTRAPARPAAPILAPETDLNVQAMYSHGVGTDGIFVLVDDREYGGSSKKLGEVCRQLQELNVKFITRRLKVADYMFVKRVAHTNQEFVIPLLVERKRMDDLAACLKTERYQRQKNAMLYLKQRYPGMMLKYLIEGNALSYLDQIVNAGFTGAKIEEVIEKCREEGFDIVRVPDIKYSLKHLSDVCQLLANSNQDDLTGMLIGSYDEFLKVVTEWKKQNKPPKTTPKTTKKQKQTSHDHNTIIITPRHPNPSVPSSSPPYSSVPSSFPPSIAQTLAPMYSSTNATTPSAPSVNCPICNNILIGSEQDNTLHINNCKIKVGGAVILHEKDDVAERECPTCHSKITGSSEKFARHVEYCLF